MFALLQRFFGIARSIDSTPTAHSWLHIFRILSLYNNCKTASRNANVVNEEKMEILVEYKNCLIDKFRAVESEREQVRLALKEQLFTELTLRYVETMKELKNTDTSVDELVYDLCGYLLKTRSHVLDCSACASLLKVDSEFDLPEDFLASIYTLERSYGFLQLATVNMFKTFREVEKVITASFSNQNVQIYARDSYEDVLSKISELNLIAVSYPEHSDVLPFLIMEYVQIRFHFEAKRFRNDNFSKANTSVHSFLKQAKNA